MTKPIVLREGDPSKTIHGAGDVYRYLATGKDTDGGYFAMHAIVPPGGGPPPHVQTREEEGFFVITGTVTFWVDGQRAEVGPGTFLHVPRGVVHNFKNESASDARMLIWFSPAGIELMFDEMAIDPDQYQAIASKYGVVFPAEDAGE